LIFDNRIEKNDGDGIYSYTYKNIRCDGKIKKNEISGNKANGIYCCGRNNKTRIESNTFIGYNKLAGIKLEDEAGCVILKNNIIRNLA